LAIIRKSSLPHFGIIEVFKHSLTLNPPRLGDTFQISPSDYVL
jgi:hypothetical protein